METNPVIEPEQNSMDKELVTPVSHDVEPSKGVDTNLKGAVEAIIFISERSISLHSIQEVIEGLDLGTIRSIVDELKQEYEQRQGAVKIVEVAGGVQMVTSPHYASFVRKFYNIKHTEKLSMPSLETLSIVAYKQPITKMEIEAIRGVNVDGVLKNLLDKDLVRIVGKKEVIGRPFVYGTTRAFLEYFGLNSLEEMPAIEQFVHILDEKEPVQITPLSEGEDVVIQGEQAIKNTNDQHPSSNDE